MFLHNNYGQTELTYEQQQAIDKREYRQEQGGKALDILGKTLQTIIGNRPSTQPSGAGAGAGYYQPPVETKKDNTGLIVFGIVAVSILTLSTVLILKKKK